MSPAAASAHSSEAQENWLHAGCLRGTVLHDVFVIVCRLPRCINVPGALLSNED